MCENKQFEVSKEIYDKDIKDIKSLVYCLISTLMFLIIPIYLKLLGIL